MEPLRTRRNRATIVGLRESLERQSATKPSFTPAQDDGPNLVVAQRCIERALQRVELGVAKAALVVGRKRQPSQTPPVGQRLMHGVDHGRGLSAFRMRAASQAMPSNETGLRASQPGSI